uniref:Uncharacterized protein n=1 Tax=Paenarthrobacter aurescens TaxID=43663 RepID=Q6SKC0_PAEAU|nr:hypothetical protein [Paenarthrobacter aurescens]
MLGHLGQRQRTGGIEDARVIDAYARQRCRFGAGGDDDVLRLQQALAAFAQFDLYTPGAVDTSPALESFHLVLAKQEFHALGQRFDAVGLLLHHLHQVERRRDLNTQGTELTTGSGLVEFGRMQQRLGRHATDVQAGATEGFAALHTGHLEPQLAGTNRRVVTARAGANDDHVIAVHCFVLESRKFAGHRSRDDRAGARGRPDHPCRSLHRLG